MTETRIRRSRTAAPLRRAPRPRALKPGTGDQFFRHLVTSLRNGVIAVTHEGRVAAINAPAYRILGLEPSLADTGRAAGALLAGEPELARVLTRASEGGHLPNRVELRLKNSGRVIGYTLSEVNDEEGTRVGTVMFFKDLTRVEQLEERERLRDRLATLGEMAAAIAHEVKNPLAGIEVMAGVLKRKLTALPDAQATLGEIINECKLANAIVVEVLEFVRPIRLEMEQHVALAPVLRDAVTMASSTTHPGRIDVTVDVPEGLPDIPGDPNQLRQLFINLLINAFEALDGRGAVAIRVRMARGEDEGEPDQLVVEVQDDGPGINADVADRVFNPFFTTKPKGTGLGLAIVRKVVDAHDAHIDMRRPPGGGTCFRVSLPATPNSKP
ncbi:MAG: ATP-binding protein [Acidobacteriota bacterium]|nr:ATP-binding protein [Acidobacteriota bacterium]